ncbi:MAG: hypothetical protein HQ591_12750 [candidate division Zixibacteria bacterium]|nr:hypothetical protein [Candidatus Tariuqbacter arcticus]
MIIKKQDVKRAFEKKLGLKPETGKENNVFVEFAGCEKIRVTYPKGRGDLHPKTASSIRKQTKLSWDDFIDLVKCPLSAKDYQKIIRNKIKQNLL